MIPAIGFRSLKLVLARANEINHDIHLGNALDKGSIENMPVVSSGI